MTLITHCQYLELRNRPLIPVSVTFLKYDITGEIVVIFLECNDKTGSLMYIIVIVALSLVYHVGVLWWRIVYSVVRVGSTPGFVSKF